MDETFLARATELGELLRAHLKDFQRDFPAIGDVRGLGPMLALELVLKDGTPDSDAVQRVVGEVLQRGLIVLRTGLYSN